MATEEVLQAGCAAFAAGALAEAEAAFRAVLAAEADNAAAWSDLAAVLNARGQPQAAEQAARRALAFSPRFWAACSTLATALHRQQRYEEAVAAYAEALRQNPFCVEAATNLGVALTEQGYAEAALPVHDYALRLAPHDAAVRCNRALALLAAGDLAQGFAENECRWLVPGMRPHQVPGRCWQGEEIAGQRLLVHDEAGFGDTLQFVRYVPLLAARGVRVLLQVQPPLLRLLSRLAGLEVVFPRGQALPEYDLHCPMLSLPHAFGTTLATVPAEIPYLFADPEAVAFWRRRLGGEALLVGLAWAGASRPTMPEAHAMDARRSLPANALSVLAAVEGVRFVSLQKGPAPPPGLALFDPMPACADFADTAAVVAALDLVIAVDTAVAHLAGALGKPVWLLSRFDMCWRWLQNRSSSPWYPTLSLYRQPRPGAWGDVLARVAFDLRCLAAGRFASSG